MNNQNEFSLEGKVAVVTGASKGIGKAMAFLMAKYGAKMVVSSRKQEAVDEVANEFISAGLDATAIECHMGDMDQIANLVEKTKEKYGGIDIIINNAAINPTYGPIQNVDGRTFNKIMEVNVQGPMELASKAYPIMKSRGGGSVINISSVEGITPGAGLGLYSVTKAALIALTKVQASEWGADSIRSNAICPGFIKTKFSAGLMDNEKIFKSIMAKQALPKVATPEDVAGLALFLASDASSFCTGGYYMVDGGYVI